MALSMARPWQHPKTGTFYLRQRVPKDVLAHAVGQRLILPVGDQGAVLTIGRTVQVSLRTSDQATAKVRHTEADVALKRFWASIRSGPVSLTQKESVMLAGLAYRETVRALEDDRSRFILRVVETAEEVGRQLSGSITFESARSEFVSLLEAQGTSAAWADYEDPQQVPLPLLEAGFGLQADALLQKHGLCIDEASRALLLREVYRAMREAAGHLERGARGDFRPDPAADRFPAYEASQSTASKPGSEMTVEALFALWCEKRKGAAENTRKRYASSFRSLAAFVGERSIKTLTGDDIYAWAEHRLNVAGVSARSINRCDIANVKAVFAWGMTRPANSIVVQNPASNIRLEEARQEKTRERTFKSSEVSIILELALKHEQNYLHPKLSAARRWCPWLAAYSGARISELTALRREDIQREAGILVMHIKATKTNEIRTVPLHEHLLEVGFLDFVESSAQGALFFDEDRKRKGNRTSLAEVVSKDIARWIRRATDLDPHVDPNHGWRHTWKTRASGCRIPEREMDAIVGHGPGSVARRYITPPIEDLTKAMRCFPRYVINIKK